MVVVEKGCRRCRGAREGKGERGTAWEVEVRGAGVCARSLLGVAGEQACVVH